MIRVRGLKKSFGLTQVLRDVAFDIVPGSIVGMIGPSGGGKSIVLKALGGAVRLDGGEVELGVSTKSAVSLMFQEGALFDSLSVFDNVAFPLVDGNVPASALPRDLLDRVVPKVEAILRRVGLSRAANKFPGQISGGMRRRVSLARALVTCPEVVLLDDPTAGLDPVASSIIMDLIVEVHREHNPVTIMVSHDLRRLLPVVDHVLALFHGSIVFSGTLQMLRESTDDELRRFVSCRFELEGGQPCSL